jgi:hypothetical protein
VIFSGLRRAAGSDIDGNPAAWRRALRTLISVIILPALGLAIIFTLAKVIAQSNSWDLPGGHLLDTILSSCQFEHTNREGIDIEAHDLLDPLRAERISKSSRTPSSPARTNAFSRTARLTFAPRYVPRGIFLWAIDRVEARSRNSLPAHYC